MKTIIAGSREGITLDDIYNAWEQSDFAISEVVSGTARGADRLGEAFAVGRWIPIKRFPANWDKYGKSAGYIRNTEMADYADALVAVWDGKSKGTKHMIDIATKKGLIVYVHHI